MKLPTSELLTSFHQTAEGHTYNKQQTDHVQEISKGAATRDEEIPRRTMQVLMPVELGP